MSASDQRQSSIQGAMLQLPVLQPPTKTQQLQNLGGLRSEHDMELDESRAGWLMSPAHMALPYILEPTTNENRLANAAFHSELQAEGLRKQVTDLGPMAKVGSQVTQQHKEQASAIGLALQVGSSVSSQQALKVKEARQTMSMQASGFHNEAISYARLDQDMRHADDESQVFAQVKVNTPQSFRQPDAVIVPPGGLNSGVVMREMKTRELDQRSRAQLTDIVGLMNNPQHSPPTMEIQGKEVQAPIMALEVEMRSSSKDLSHHTLGFMQGLDQQTAKPVLMRTQSMSDFRPIQDVIQRQQIHHS